jgi:L-seryl-tRNA(Ser) seleniumtransferase
MEFRDLPAVDEIVQALAGRFPHRLMVDEARRLLAEWRREIAAGRAVDAAAAAGIVAHRLHQLAQPSLRRVINATGVILHTNLGRAPLPEGEPLAGYVNLEYDLATGKRGKRDAHVAGLWERLVGAPTIVVNNNAAAVYLVLHELAAGAEVIVSRGELIEIGDGFRIPDIMTRSGAILREVGTTNRTSLDDYRHAINERTRLLMRVHPSNFHQTGFTGKPTLAELAGLARERGVPLYEDLGSGCVVDLTRYGIHEPLVQDSLAAGVDLVTWSGDKLLGGPQAGLIAGRAEVVQRIRRNPMYRALRVDKLITHSMAVTLGHLLFERYDAIPALRMIRASAAEIRTRAEALAARIPGADVLAGESLAGGGSTPDQSLPTFLVVLPGDAVRQERQLRAGTPPVIARILDDRLVIDLRTVFPEQEPALLAALAQCG